MNFQVYNEIKKLADKYANDLKNQVMLRENEMELDDNSHYLIYRVLGITDKEGRLIDLYQNKGRFLYKYAGSFLEQATALCMQYKYPNAEGKVRINNTEGKKPKHFEIDFLVNNIAYEIKWRDATTDGDHITKEHTRVMAICNSGYKPVRIMFYYPNRAQAIKIQQTLETIYKGIGGEYFYGDNAWKYIQSFTGINLLEILTDIASTRM